MARSTRQIGNGHENDFCDIAEALGYCTYPSRGSRGPVDVVCFDDHHSSGADAREFWGSPRVSLVVQVGTHNKPIAKTLAELEAAPRPIGSLCIVARRKLNKSRRIVWTFHTRAGTFDTLEQAIAERIAA